MAESTGIEWCDATFNPWWGCERVSPACAHCYADMLATRYGYASTWGDDQHGFRFFGDEHWKDPLRWARNLPKKLGRRPRVFCASMADVFEERTELDAHRDRLFRLIYDTPELDWLLLTKRPEFARDWLDKFYDRSDEAYGHAAGARASWPPAPNVWLGVSVENVRYTWRADVLRSIPAAVRFISAEPLLGSLFAECPACGDRGYEVHQVGEDEYEPHQCDRCQGNRHALSLEGIDWVIAGGESGAKARPTDPAWFRELRDACVNPPPLEAGAVAWERHVNQGATAFLFKQWGTWVPSGFVSSRYSERYPRAKTTTTGGWTMLNVGKKEAGRELDGRTWDEFPEPRT